MIITELFILLNLFSGIEVSWWWVIAFIICDWTVWGGVRELIKLRKVVVDKEKGDKDE